MEEHFGYVAGDWFEQESRGQKEPKSAPVAVLGIGRNVSLIYGQWLYKGCFTTNKENVSRPLIA